MNELKKILSLIFLVVITAAVILAPHFLNSQKEARLINDESYWNYRGKSNFKITGKQVAEAFYNGELDINSNVTSQEKNLNASEIKDDCTKLFQSVFKDNADFANHIIDMIDNNSYFYSNTNNILIMLEERPVALTLVSITISSKNESLDIVFENKTKTLLNFNYFVEINEFNDNRIPKDDLEKSIKSYYKNDLDLSEDLFDFHCELIKNDYLNFYTSCGVSQYHEEIVTKETEKYAF